MNFPRKRYLVAFVVIVAGSAGAAITLFARAVVAYATAPGDAAKTHIPRMSYLDNGTLRLGVDLNLGGAITYLSPSGKARNVVNDWDWGRQIQMSYYSGPVPYTVGAKRPAKHWAHLGWNPIQAGDDYGNPARVLEHRNDGKSIYVQCVPMQWPLNNEPGECTFETWISLDGPAARVRCRLKNARSDRNQYGARTQELPAVYVNGPYYRLMTYTGAQPFTGGELRRIEKKPGDKGPWSSWMATENWAAQVNDAGWGLGVWHPGCYRFSGGFAGKPGQGGSRDNPTGYIAPNRLEILDHNIHHEYEYVLILGKLDEIRQYVYRHAPRPAPPDYLFQKDRQGWYYIHAADSGWPIRGELRVALEEPDPQLIGPAGFWKAAAAPVLYVDAAYRTSAHEAQVFWATLEDARFTEDRSVHFPIKGDGFFRTYAVKLSAAAKYQGIITGLRFDPVPAGRKGDWVRLRSIGFGNRLRP